MSVGISNCGVVLITVRSIEKNLLRVPAKAAEHSDVKSATEAGIRDEAGSLPRGRDDVTETGMRAPLGGCTASQIWDGGRVMNVGGVRVLPAWLRVSGDSVAE